MRNFTGALEDNRSTLEKSKDYSFEEIVASANPVQWVEKNYDQWRKYPTFNQDGSSSCVAQTIAKMVGIHEHLNHGSFIHFSASYIYQKRSNAPGLGMIGVNAFEILRNKGITLEELMPSQNMNEQEINSVSEDVSDRRVAQVFKIKNYVVVPIRNIETVASIIQTTSKPVMVWFRSSYRAWNAERPRLPMAETLDVHHSVTATDYCLIDGRKHLIVEDQWGTTGFKETGQRAISEEVFNNTNTFVAYFMNLDYDTRETKDEFELPKHKFNKKLYYGMRNDSDVKAMQKILKHLGYFPANVEATGNYFGLTAKAVLRFQKEHMKLPESILSQLTGSNSVVGPKTREALNSL